MSDRMLATPLDGLLVDAFPSTRSPQEEAPVDPSPILTADQLADIRARVDASSPHEWGATESGWIESDAGTLVAQAYAGTSQRRSANARFIAHARQDVPALLDHIDEITRSYQDLVERSAQEADRAQALVLRKDEEIAAHDDLHRAAAHRIEQLVERIAVVEHQRDALVEKLETVEHQRDRQLQAVDDAREIIRLALTKMREPLTHTDAQRAREILQKYHHECAVAAVRARRETAPFPTAPGASL